MSLPTDPSVRDLRVRFCDDCLEEEPRPGGARVIPWLSRAPLGASARAAAPEEVPAAEHDIASCDRERSALRRKIQGFDAVLANMADLVWMKDRHSRFVIVNEALAQVAGTTPEQMVGRMDADYFPPELVQSYVSGDEQVLASLEELRTTEEIVTSAGETRWIETIKNPAFDRFGELIGVTGVARDVTAQNVLANERQDLLRRLAAEHQRLSDTIQNVPGVVWEEWFDGSYRYVSNAVQEMQGYSPEEYLATFPSFLDALHPDDAAEARQRTEQMIAAATGGTGTFRMLCRDGTVIWCESHCSPIFEEGRMVGLRGVSMDVTSRKLAENVLRGSEERFRELVDTAPVMLWTSDGTGNLTFLSRQLLDFLGKDNETALGEAWLDGVHPDDLERVTSVLAQATGAPTFLRYESRYRCANGEYRQVLVEGVPRFGEGATFLGLVGNVVDLTELRQLERRVEESRRLSSLGKLAATIAHEINNVLMGVQPFADIIVRASSPETIQNAAAQIRKSVERGRRITHGILGYANTAAPQIQTLNVEQWTREHLPELGAIAGKAVVIETEIEDGLLILADGAQLQQVFANLVANARDAMPGGGKVRIVAQRGRGRREGRAHLTVSDTGCGMEKAILEQIFDPLFTTKGSTGLGLPLVRDVVERHGGEITAESVPQRGSVFHILLPLTESAPEVAAPPRQVPAVRHRRILLVEDDPLVSAGLTGLLELEGIEVAIAARAQDTLAAIEAFKPDAIVLDVGLPDVPGTEVFGWIRAADPTMPVLFSTGHGRELELKTYLAEPATAYLLKPYSVDALLEALAAI